VRALAEAARALALILWPAGRPRRRPAAQRSRNARETAAFL